MFLSSLIVKSCLHTTHCTSTSRKPDQQSLQALNSGRSIVVNCFKHTTFVVTRLHCFLQNSHITKAFWYASMARSLLISGFSSCPVLCHSKPTALSIVLDLLNPLYGSINGSDDGCLAKCILLYLLSRRIAQ